MKWIILFVWIELILLFSLGCSAPKERRGDWMEHLNHRQFTYNAPMIHWDRYSRYSEEELREMWEEEYEKAIKDIPNAVRRIQENYNKKELEPISSDGQQ